jgi:hypothetical protein
MNFWKFVENSIGILKLNQKTDKWLHYKHRQSQIVCFKESKFLKGIKKQTSGITQNKLEEVEENEIKDIKNKHRKYSKVKNEQHISKLNAIF